MSKGGTQGSSQMKLEKVPGPEGQAAGMKAGLRRRIQSKGKCSWKTLPKPHHRKQVPRAAIMRGYRLFWVIGPTWQEEGKKGKHPPPTSPP